MAKSDRRICILGALGVELKGIARGLAALAEDPRVPAARVGTLGGARVGLVRTGVGRKAGEAAAAALDVFEPELLLCVGTAGALVPGLKVGDVVAAARAVGPQGGAPVPCDVPWIGRAVAAGAREGACLTVARPLATAGEKSAAARASGATVCEMEAWFVGREAARRSVPFLALKTVSDALADRLPDTGRFMDASGVLDAKAFAAYLALRPDEAARSARFVRNAARACTSLAGVVLSLLRSGPE